eukprot:6179728-Pleurochrysis_carterae.AAC.1
MHRLRPELNRRLRQAECVRRTLSETREGHCAAACDRARCACARARGVLPGKGGELRRGKRSR